MRCRNEKENLSDGPHAPADECRENNLRVYSWVILRVDAVDREVESGCEENANELREDVVYAFLGVNPHAILASVVDHVRGRGEVIAEKQTHQEGHAVANETLVLSESTLHEPAKLSAFCLQRNRMDDEHSPIHMNAGCLCVNVLIAQVTINDIIHGSRRGCCVRLKVECLISGRRVGVGARLHESKYSH